MKEESEQRYQSTIGKENEIILATQKAQTHLQAQSELFEQQICHLRSTIRDQDERLSIAQ